MFRLLTVWRLRRAQARLQSEIDWIRQTIYAHQFRLAALEARERAVQGELWVVESPRSLLPDSGISQRG